MKYLWYVVLLYVRYHVCVEMPNDDDADRPRSLADGRTQTATVLLVLDVCAMIYVYLPSAVRWRGSRRSSI